MGNNLCIHCQKRCWWRCFHSRNICHAAGRNLCCDGLTKTAVCFSLMFQVFYGNLDGTFVYGLCLHQASNQQYDNTMRVPFTMVLISLSRMMFPRDTSGSLVGFLPSSHCSLEVPMSGVNPGAMSLQKTKRRRQVMMVKKAKRPKLYFWTSLGASKQLSIWYQYDLFEAKYWDGGVVNTAILPCRRERDNVGSEHSAIHHNTIAGFADVYVRNVLG